MDLGMACIGYVSYIYTYIVLLSWYWLMVSLLVWVGICVVGLGWVSLKYSLILESPHD